MDDSSLKWVQTFLGEIGGNGGSGVLKLIKLNENWLFISCKQMKGLGKFLAR